MTSDSALRRPTGLLRELIAFGAVGLLGFVVDVGVFNLLRLTLLPQDVVLAKVVSVTIATAVAWLGHRTLTFAERGGGPIGREALLFALANVGGLAIAAGCLALSHYGLGLRGVVADNVSGNGVGLVLATAFRYACYRLFVFRRPSSPVPVRTASAPTA